MTQRARDPKPTVTHLVMAESDPQVTHSEWATLACTSKVLRNPLKIRLNSLQFLAKAWTCKGLDLQRLGSSKAGPPKAGPSKACAFKGWTFKGLDLQRLGSSKAGPSKAGPSKALALKGWTVKGWTFKGLDLQSLDLQSLGGRFGQNFPTENSSAISKG